MGGHGEIYIKCFVFDGRDVFFPCNFVLLRHEDRATCRTRAFRRSAGHLATSVHYMSSQRTRIVFICIGLHSVDTRRHFGESWLYLLQFSSHPPCNKGRGGILVSCQLPLAAIPLFVKMTINQTVKQYACIHIGVRVPCWVGGWTEELNIHDSVKRSD